MPPALGIRGHRRQGFRDTRHAPGAKCSRDTSLHATEIRRWNVSLRVPQIRQAPTECASTPGTKNLLHTLALVLASRAGTRVGAFARPRARRACARLRLTRACACSRHPRARRAPASPTRAHARRVLRHASRAPPGAAGATPGAVGAGTAGAAPGACRARDSVTVLGVSSARMRASKLANEISAAGASRVTLGAAFFPNLPQASRTDLAACARALLGAFLERITARNVASARASSSGAEKGACERA